MKNDVVDNTTIMARYERAQTLMQGFWTRNIVPNGTVYPTWIEGSDCFWYERELNTKAAKGERDAAGLLPRCGREYRLVNAATATNTLAFDHKILAAALAETLGETVDDYDLPISKMKITLEPGSSTVAKVTFLAFEKYWCFVPSSEVLSEQVRPFDPQQCQVSPDGKKALFTRDHNLWVKDLDSEEERALTRDGEALYCYAASGNGWSHEMLALPPGPQARWSADSKTVFTVQRDSRQVKTLPIVEHVPKDGSIRPKLKQVVKAMQGDEHVPEYRLLAIHIDSGRVQPANYGRVTIVRNSWGFFSSRLGWWSTDKRIAYFVDLARDYRSIRVVEFDTQTGATRVLFEERSDTHINLMLNGDDYPTFVAIPETNELVWYSERSGWAHIYLYDLNTGELKNTITSGDWVVRSVLHIDIERRELWIQTAGRAKGRNPYYCDICRVNMDTGELTEVLATDHEYTVCDRRSRVATADTSAQGVSSCGDYAVVTRSRVDERPVSLLLDRDGKILQTLETADISGLVENWQWPEPVITRADDGTDIYGVVFRPSDFDANKSYPVLDCTYYYSAPVGSFTNNFAGDRHYLSPAAYAELGFIVVMFNNRGNEGLRNTAFAAYQDPVFPLPHSCMLKYNKSDCVAGIQQLAERYPYMDLKRVGVAGTSSVPAPVLAMLAYPDFYKVGVSQNQMLDLRLMSAVGMSQDLATCPQLEDLAENLQGKLLLIAGMMDDVLPVSMTFRLVEALQKANKRFDMLILPNLDHTAPGYPLQRSWDYFVEHLLGLEPPEDFKLVNGMDLAMAQWARESG